MLKPDTLYFSCQAGVYNIASVIRLAAEHGWDGGRYGKFDALSDEELLENEIVYDRLEAAELWINRNAVHPGQLFGETEHGDWFCQSKEWWALQWDWEANYDPSYEPPVTY